MNDDKSDAFDPGAETVARPPGANITIKELEKVWGGTIHGNVTIDSSLKSRSHTKNTPSGLAVTSMRVSETGAPAEPPPQYELIATLGQGGMGVIYTAKQASLGRTIAMKMIKGEAAANDMNRNQFLSEAAVTGDLAHPNIVPIYDLGANDQGELFYAMKKVEGTPWDEVVREKPLNENLDILMHVADAVAFAHSRGVIHRDLKPENVMLGEFGEVLVMDWGLAVSITPDGKAEPLASSQAGGTPSYMAPEMAEGDPDRVGIHSDVYLLGGILYEIVTELKPHTGDGILNCFYNISRNIIQESPVEGELINIALTAMATDPKDRYATVKEFQQAIRNYEAHSESIALCEKAQRDLMRGRESSDYNILAQTVFGFRQAWELWEENLEARKGLQDAQLAYAVCAMNKGDFDLAASQLDITVEEHRKLGQEVDKARKERDKHKKETRQMVYIAGLLVLAVIIALIQTYFRIQKDKAKAKAALAIVTTERDGAVSAREKAEKELAEEKEKRARAEAKIEEMRAAWPKEKPLPHKTEH